MGRPPLVSQGRTQQHRSAGRPTRGLGLPAANATAVAKGVISPGFCH
jgi:hypothetical protein